MTSGWSVWGLSKFLRLICMPNILEAKSFSWYVFNCNKKDTHTQRAVQITKQLILSVTHSVHHFLIHPLEILTVCLSWVFPSSTVAWWDHLANGTPPPPTHLLLSSGATHPSVRRWGLLPGTLCLLTPAISPTPSLITSNQTKPPVEDSVFPSCPRVQVGAGRLLHFFSLTIASVQFGVIWMCQSKLIPSIISDCSFIAQAIWWSSQLVST